MLTFSLERCIYTSVIVSLIPSVYASSVTSSTFNPILPINIDEAIVGDVLASTLRSRTTADADDPDIEDWEAVNGKYQPITIPERGLFHREVAAEYTDSERAQVQKRRNRDPKFLGTNDNAKPAKGNSVLYLSGGGQNYNVRSDILTIRSDPVALDDDCPGKLPTESCLGGDHGGLTKGTFLPASNVLLSSHVNQGGFGDCAFGAAIKSMILTGRQKALQKKFWQPGRFPNSPGWENTIICMAQFYKLNNDASTVIVDDGLAKPCAADGKDYFSFEPSDDNVFFVPLLEKAYAKFGDAYPELVHSSNLRPPSTSEEVWGMNGLTGTSGGGVLRALRGGTAYKSLRQQTNGETNPKFIQWIKNCLDQNIPCTLGTPKLYDGKDPITRIHLDPFPTGRTYLSKSDHALGGMKAKLYNAWTIQNVLPSSRPGTYFLVQNKDLDREYVMVGHHAYSLSRSTKKDMLIVSNPWGCTPILGGGCEGNGEIEMYVQTAAAFFRSLEWVQ